MRVSGWFLCLSMKKSAASMVMVPILLFELFMVDLFGSGVLCALC